jgi:hypothetical protein
MKESEVQMNGLKKVVHSFQRRRYLLAKLALGKFAHFFANSFTKSFFIKRKSMDSNFFQTKRLAVVAIYPSVNELYIISLTNLCKGLQKNGYHILFVSNNALSDPPIKDTIEYFSASYIERYNFGRDFGSYQTAVLYLDRENVLRTLDNLLLVNDTLIWISDSQTVVEPLATKDFGAIWMNLEQNVHAHSFFLSFSAKTISNSQFLKFWKKYVPTNSRNLAIHRGENALTNILADEGIYCSPLVDTEYLDSELKRIAKDDHLAHRQVMNSRICKLFPSLPPNAPAGFLQYDSSNIDMLHRANSNLEEYVYSDAPHRLGLVFASLGRLPIKCDLFKFYNLAEIEKSLLQLEPVLQKLIVNYFLIRSIKFQVSTKINNKLRRLGEI